MTTSRQHATEANRLARRRAFTLAELMVSMSIMAVLMSAMGSAVLIATHALPDGKSALEAGAQAADVVNGIVEDLVYALQIKTPSSTGVTFTVADRGHGSVGLEAIRLNWSGTPGDPLVRQYNGGANVNLCDNVQSFSLTFARRPAPPSATSNLLFVTNNAVSPSADDLVKISKFESWGYTVQTIADSDTIGAFDTAIAASDVIFVSEYAWGLNLSSKPIDGPTGVVAEEQFMSVSLGMAAAYWYDIVDNIEIVDNTHEITSGTTLGTLVVCTSFESLSSLSGTLAPGARVLADSSSSPSLVALEVGAARYGGGTADGRRVKLPWGGTALGHYSFASLNTPALRLMRRSLAWASVPSVYSSVRIHLQIGSNSAGATDTSVQLLNAPEAG